MRTKLIILSSIVMALVVMAFPTNKFQPKTVWEHYCKYTLHIHNPTRPTDNPINPIRDLNPKNTKLLTHQTKTNNQ